MFGLRFASGTVMKRGAAYTLKASGAETVSTIGPQVIDTGESGVVYVQVDVTAVSGSTPSMTVVIEGSNDGSAWFTLGTIGANGYVVGSVGSAPSNFTAAATTRAAFPAMQFVRYRSVIGGSTPSFTYVVAMEAN